MIATSHGTIFLPGTDPVTPTVLPCFPENTAVTLARYSEFMTTSRDLLRHALATLAYRAGKAIRGAPDGFADFRVFETSRTAGRLLAHMADLMDWALSVARGDETWRDSKSLDWEQGTGRFFASLAALDAYLASAAPLETTPEKLFQGPIADALTHVGQLAMMRRAAGAALRGENYFVAEVAAGRVGIDQTPPRREFD
jgi:hypothetical protein